MRSRRIEVEIGSLVVDGPALARTDVAATLERELGQLLAADGLAQGSKRSTTSGPRRPQAPLAAVAREIHGRLAR